MAEKGCQIQDIDRAKKQAARRNGIITSSLRTGHGILTMFDFIDDYPGDNVSYPQNGLYIPDATECMRCGLCISLCPTYKLFRIEAETPRSRVRTIDKIINGNTAVSGEELKHLNNCTQCRACETICPSKMAYGHLFDLAREQRFQAELRNGAAIFLAL